MTAPGSDTCSITSRTAADLHGPIGERQLLGECAGEHRHTSGCADHPLRDDEPLERHVDADRGPSIGGGSREQRPWAAADVEERAGLCLKRRKPSVQLFA